MAEQISIVSAKPWREIEASLRRVPLQGDNTLLPYADAVISSRVVETDTIAPLARYVLFDHLKTQAQLHATFIRQAKIDTLDLHGKRGGIRYRVGADSEIWEMVPPIVEVSDIDGGVPVLLDGEHRFMLARELGQKVRVIWIEQVDKRAPTMAKPIEWGEVSVHNEVPPLINKRDYRYPTLGSFPDISGLSRVPVTEENYLYFFYRDLSGVCSSGVRG